MAVLKITDGTTSVNLLDNTKYALEFGKDQISVKSGKQQTMVFYVNVHGATNATVQSNFNALIRLLDQGASWHQDGLMRQEKAVFLYRENSGETTGGGAQALIYNYDVKMLPTTAVGAIQLLTPRLFIALSVTVGGWESPTQDAALFVSLSIHGGHDSCDELDLFTPLRDSRISVLTVQNDMSSTLSKVWIGLKPGHTAATLYNPVWKLENGVLLNSSTLTTSTGKIGTNIVQTAFGSPSMLDRVSISLYNINPAMGTDAVLRYQGEFFVLARLKLTNANTDVFMKLGGGYKFSEIAYNETVRFTGQTTWTYVPMGRITLPATHRRGSIQELIAYYSLYLAAERNAGTGSLQMDTLVLIPYEHFLSCDAEIDGTKSMNIVAYPDGAVDAYTYGSVIVAPPKITSVNNFYFPYDYRSGGNPPQIVVVGQDGGTTADKTLNVVVNVHAGQVFYGNQ